MPRRVNQLKSNSFREQKIKLLKKKKKRTAWSFRPFVFLKNDKFHRVFGFFLVLASIYLLIAFISFFYTGYIDFDKIASNSFFKLNQYPEIQNWTGFTGAYLSKFFINDTLGLSAFILVINLFVYGIYLMVRIKLLPLARLFRHSLLFLIWLPVTLGIIFMNTNFSVFGGVFGYQANLILIEFIGVPGVIIGIIFVFFSYIIISFNIRIKLFNKTDKKEETDSQRTGTKPGSDKYNTVEFSVTEDEDFERKDSGAKTDGKDEQEIDEFPDPELELTDDKPDPVSKSDIELTVEQSAREKKDFRNGEIEHFGIDSEYDPTLELASYTLPKLDLLDSYRDDEVSVHKDELEENKNRIVETLNHYSIKIDKIKATIGPAVTLYEIIPAPGVRISKIKNLEDDIALSLSAMGIRIIAPIPGKGTIGIEVPNKNPEIVSMKSLLASQKFRNTTFELPLALGKTISNESYIVDLTKMPHILMAGATGQGKSVGLNAILASLLYKKHPSQIKFILVDPKKVELSLFSKIERHFLAKLPDSEEAIITDTRLVVRTLNSLTIEMDNRYELLKDAQVRNIKEYNTKFIARKLSPVHGHRFLPYLILVVDEFADLIMTAGKEIENPLTRLAQLSRAIGIHLIIATQRPSVNIITGTIKANFPARIAFRVISKIDSRTILDTGGADQLIGRGDMLLATGSDLIRLQCAFVDTTEVERLTDFIGSQRAYPNAFHLPEFAEEQDINGTDIDLNERDELFEDAARIIVQTQQGSTSLLQRKLKLGYNRAGRIIDQLEAAGIVGPFEGSKAREVKVANEFALEQFLKDLNENHSKSI